MATSPRRATGTTSSAVGTAPTVPTQGPSETTTLRPRCRRSPNSTAAATEPRRMIGRRPALAILVLALAGRTACRDREPAPQLRFATFNIEDFPKDARQVAGA